MHISHHEIVEDMRYLAYVRRQRPKLDWTAYTLQHFVAATLNQWSMHACVPSGQTTFTGIRQQIGHSTIHITWPVSAQQDTYMQHNDSLGLLACQ